MKIHVSPPAKEQADREPQATKLGNSDSFFVYYSPTAFTLWWTGVLLFHALCLSFYALWAFIYVTLYTTGIAQTLQVYGFALQQSQFPYIAAVYSLFATVHASHALWMLLCSLFHRTLLFNLTQATRETGDRVRSRRRKTTALAVHFSRSQLLTRFVKQVSHRVYDAFCRRDGLFGIASEHFYLVFLLLEAFEITLQTIQAYRLTKWVSRQWLSRTYAVFIAINCWSTWLIQRLYKRDPAKQRLLCRAWDMVMDFLSTVLLPIVMALPYIPLYDAQQRTLDYELFYDNAKLINALNEFRILIVSSWFDVANLVCFSLLLLDCLDIVKSSVRPRPPSMAHLSIRQLETKRVEEAAAAATTATENDQRVSMRIVHWCHRLFLVWGLAIVAVQIQAEARPSPSGCLRQVRPWFESRTACSFLRLHCGVAGVTGSRADLHRMVEGMVPEMVLIAEFRHCPALEITTDLHQFRRIYGLKIFKSTLLSWDDAAELTEAYFPDMNFLHVVLTPFPGNVLPRALHVGPLPTKLTDVEFPGTGLSSLPADLDQIWTNPIVLALDNNSFTEVPDVVTRLDVQFLSLVNNQLTALPRTLLSGSQAWSLWFNGNPIQELPLHVVPGATFMRLRLQHSNITSLPKWMTTFLKTNEGIVRLANSPLCEAIGTAIASLDRDAGEAAITAAVSWLGDAAPFVAMGGIDCTPDTGDLFTYYPYDLEDSFDN